MALTTLDPATALIVVDLQQGVAGVPTVPPVNEVVARANELIGAFRRHGLPIVLVVVAGSPPGRTDHGSRRSGPVPDGYADLIPDLAAAPDDYRVTKYARSAFAGTNLADHLRSRAITQVVLTGVATSSGVESTARSAHDEGFNVTVAVDAMADSRPDDHDYAITHVFPRIGETGTTAQIIELLDRTRAETRGDTRTETSTDTGTETRA